MVTFHKCEAADALVPAELKQHGWVNESSGYVGIRWDRQIGNTRSGYWLLQLKKAGKYDKYMRHEVAKFSFDYSLHPDEWIKGVNKALTDAIRAATGPQRPEAS